MPLVLLTLLAATPAWAGDAPAPQAPEGETLGDVDPEFRLGLPDGWDWEPYWRPEGGLVVYGNGYAATQALALGLSGGVQYWDTEGPLRGRTRARLMGSLTGGGWGGDVRLGSFIGPAKEYWSVMIGPDVFRNTFRAGPIVLEPTWGLDVPLTLTLGPSSAYAVAGVTPALLLNPDRRVEWDEIDAIGFGHEFEIMAGGIINTRYFKMGLIWSRRITATGVQQGWGFSAGF
ncbi:MAG: hypothetical protein H6739_34355 [Alphaproteobacteria bacterium]|nr:hypothetical protein [Alphaproteobacteria bacterium]